MLSLEPAGKTTSLGVTALDAPITTGTTDAFSSSSFSPLKIVSLFFELLVFLLDVAITLGLLRLSLLLSSAFCSPPWCPVD